MKKSYWKYFKYIIEHKKNVFKICLKKGMLIHAITHDLSKFRPREFKAYAEYFYGQNNILHELIIEKDFELAWLHHQHTNKHHWDYWVNSRGEALPMPHKYIDQMIVDWEAMGLKFGNTAKEFYEFKGKEMILHRATRSLLEYRLGLIDYEDTIYGRSIFDIKE